MSETQNRMGSKCDVCGFELWQPIASLSDSTIGLYSDVRFPGRSIVMLHEHYDHLDEVPPDTMLGFMSNVKDCIVAIKRSTGVDRVNMAILGNEIGHIHAHLIPRMPMAEPRPNRAPWEDTRSKGPLPAREEAQLKGSIREELGHILALSRNFPRELSPSGIRKVRAAPIQMPSLPLFPYENEPARERK